MLKFKTYTVGKYRLVQDVNVTNWENTAAHYELRAHIDFPEIEEIQFDKKTSKIRGRLENTENWIDLLQTYPEFTYAEKYVESEVCLYSMLEGLIKNYNQCL